MGIGPKPPALGRNVLKFRKHRNLSLEELAQRSGVSKAMLSQVEQEKVNPTVAVVWKIAHGLGVSIHELLGTEETKRRIEVTRKENATVLREESCEVQILSPIEMAEDLEFYFVRFNPGGSLVSSPHFPRTEEFTTCLSGVLEVTSGELSTVALNPGDMAHYTADVAHAIRAKGSAPAEAFLIVRYAK